MEETYNSEDSSGQKSSVGSYDAQRLENGRGVVVDGINATAILPKLQLSVSIGVRDEAYFETEGSN